MFFSVKEVLSKICGLMESILFEKPAALSNIELASFLQWYVKVELYDPAYTRRFHCTYELLQESMSQVSLMIFCVIKFYYS